MSFDLIEPEIDTLQMIAGHKPVEASVTFAICVEELSHRGLCTPDSTPELTAEGLAALEEATGTIDLISRAQGKRIISFW